MAGRCSRAANVRAGLVMEQWRRFEETGVQPSFEELLTAQAGQGASRPSGQRGQRTRATLIDHLNWLRTAGFDEVECFWRDGSHALTGGYRRSATS